MGCICYFILSEADIYAGGGSALRLLAELSESEGTNDGNSSLTHSIVWLDMIPYDHGF